MNDGEFRDRLIETALRMGYLDDAGVQEAFRIVREGSSDGKQARLHDVLLQHNLMTREQIVETRRTMAQEGVHIRLGDFEIISRLGRGSMGTVYRARQRSLDREVAVKVLAAHLATDHAFVNRFLREARAAAKIWHPNVVQVFDVGRTRHTYYIVMEYVAGPTLKRVLDSEGIIGEDRARDLAVYVARALAVTEASGMVHRDVKPGNIILAAGGVAKLADLGLAVAEEEEAEEGGGTPLYMAPEQARGETALDVRTDIYALGCTLFHAVTGRPPYDGRTSAETLRMHDEAPVPDAASLRSELSADFCAVVKRMMAKKPRERFGSAGDLLAALSETEGFVPPPEPEPTVAPVPTPQSTSVLSTPSATQVMPPQELQLAGAPVPKWAVVVAALLVALAAVAVILYIVLTDVS